MNRTKLLHRLATEEFDLCIIGAGASGAGCALDAALRGWKVALIDQADFAAETSSRSTKLVHGGVRYLEQAFKKLDFSQLRQVRHGLEERRLVLRNAPHLAQPLGLITPVFSGWEGFYFSIGLKLYDWLAGIGNKSRASKSGPSLIPRSRWLSKKEALLRMPGLSPRIHSAVLYYDGQLDDARYCLGLVQTAHEKAAAVVANYVQVLDFDKDIRGNLQAVRVRDVLGHQPDFQIKAQRFLNCTGPFSDAVRQTANPLLPTRIRPSKGVHLVLPGHYLQSHDAMLIPKTPDGRMVFAIPFEGMLLLGTTDEPYQDLKKEAVLEAKEVDYLLNTLQPYLTQTIDKQDITSGFGGIRPLLEAKKGSANARQTKSLLRDHEVEYDATSGLISLLGGKWTTYRLMARDAVDVAFQISQKAQGKHEIPAATTQEMALVGSEGYTPDFWQKLSREFGFDADISQHLASKYGVLASKVGQIAVKTAALAQRIHPNYPFIQAEIVYATDCEMAMTIRDFLARRVRLEILDWSAAWQASPVVAQRMGQTLGWSQEEQTRHTVAYQALLESFMASSGVSSQALAR